MNETDIKNQRVAIWRQLCQYVKVVDHDAPTAQRVVGFVDGQKMAL